MIVLFGPVGAKLQWDDIYPSRFRMRNHLREFIFVERRTC
jgi:hypothetical protein